MVKDIITLGHAITDIIVNVTDEELSSVGIKKGSYSTKNREGVQNLVKNKEQKIVVGGSPTNVAFGTNYLNLKTSFIGCVGRDTNGKNFINMLVDEGIEPIMGRLKEGNSGVCYALITPDGERSFSPNLGVAPDYNIDFQRIPQAKVFHTSGYELKDNPEFVKQAMNHAKSRGMLTSFDVADHIMNEEHKKNLDYILGVSDIVFITEDESRAFTKKDPTPAIELISKDVPIVVFKKYDKESIVIHHNKKHFISRYKTEIVNTNGAGDSYTAGFLFGIVNNFPIKECGHMGSWYASRVCSQEEPHCSKAIKSTIIYHNQPNNQH